MSVVCLNQNFSLSFWPSGQFHQTALDFSQFSQVIQDNNAQISWPRVDGQNNTQSPSEKFISGPNHPETKIGQIGWNYRKTRVSGQERPPFLEPGAYLDKMAPIWAQHPYLPLKKHRDLRIVSKVSATEGELPSSITCAKLHLKSSTTATA